MAVPTAPTQTSIVTEGLTKSGISNPTVAEINRAQDEWMQEIKHDIWEEAKKLKSLYTENVIATVNGIDKYSNPSDYSSDMTLTLLDGTVNGTAQAGASSTITFEGDVTTGMIGKEVFLYSGTGASDSNPIRQITSIDTTTKIVTVGVAWGTVPDNTTKYLLIESYTKLAPEPVYVFDNKNSSERGSPRNYFPIGDADTGEYYLFPAPYKETAIPYGLRMRYYADLTKIDLTGALMTTIYNRFRSVMVQGVFTKSLENLDDNRANTEFQKYMQMVVRVVRREQYGQDMSNQIIRVER